MNNQHFQEASFIPMFNGVRVDGDAFFVDDNNRDLEKRLSTTISEAYFHQGKLWVMSDFLGPFIIGTLYDDNPSTHLKGLSHVLAAAFIDERYSCE